MEITLPWALFGVLLLLNLLYIAYRTGHSDGENAGAASFNPKAGLIPPPQPSWERWERGVRHGDLRDDFSDGVRERPATTNPIPQPKPEARH